LLATLHAVPLKQVLQQAMQAYADNDAERATGAGKEEL
jgi:hypothetical protein